MRAVFHFDADIYAENSELTWARPFLEALLASTPIYRRHLRVHYGDLFLSIGTRSAEVHKQAAAMLLTEAPRAWCTLQPRAFLDAAASKMLFAFDVRGLTLIAAHAMDEGLRGQYGDLYLGALEVDVRSDAHWVLYDQALIPKYRLVADTLRILHTADDLDADPQTGLMGDWAETGLFARVELESIGLAQTIFDPYDTREQAQRTADVFELVSSQFGAVAEETLIRLAELDPGLMDVLHAAFTTAENAETTEQLAQVALSCRRFTERLADRLYPPTDQRPGGRDLGPAQSRNRLWAYVEEQLTGRAKELVLASLTDVGGRIDALDGSANRGLHGNTITTAELQRLLFTLMALTHDILTLAPPPLIADMDRYTEPLAAFIRDANALAEDPSNEKTDSSD